MSKTISIGDVKEALDALTKRVTALESKGEAIEFPSKEDIKAMDGDEMREVCENIGIKTDELKDKELRTHLLTVVDVVDSDDASELDEDALTELAVALGVDVDKDDAEETFKSLKAYINKEDDAEAPAAKKKSKSDEDDDADSGDDDEDEKPAKKKSKSADEDDGEEESDDDDEDEKPAKKKSKASDEDEEEEKEEVDDDEDEKPAKKKSKSKDDEDDDDGESSDDDEDEKPKRKKADDDGDDESSDKEESSDDEGSGEEIDRAAVVKKLGKFPDEIKMVKRLKAFNAVADDTIDAKKLGTKKAYAKLLELCVDDDGKIAEWGTPYISGDEGFCCGLAMEDVKFKKDETDYGKCQVTQKTYSLDDDGDWVEKE